MHLHIRSRFSAFARPRPRRPRARALASSHMDAPLVTLDDAANTTDVYAFVTRARRRPLPDHRARRLPVRGARHRAEQVQLRRRRPLRDPRGDGRRSRRGPRVDLSYQFEFTTRFKNEATILQSYLGVVQDVDDANQNLTQTYSVRKVDGAARRSRAARHAASCRRTTRASRRPSTTRATTARIRRATESRRRPSSTATPAQSIASLDSGYRAFAGQRDDGFYADIQSIFDLLQLRSGDDRFDSQGGFNVHTIVLEIPLAELGGEQQVVGVYATTSRRGVTRAARQRQRSTSGDFVQVGRQGNPLFCEGLVAIADKDRYNRTQADPGRRAVREVRGDSRARGADQRAPRSAATKVALETGRSDLRGIFIPDLIKVDLSTGPARLAGGGADASDQSRRRRASRASRSSAATC